MGSALSIFVIASILFDIPKSASPSSSRSIFSSPSTCEATVLSLKSSNTIKLVLSNWIQSNTIHPGNVSELFPKKSFATLIFVAPL